MSGRADRHLAELLEAQRIEAGLRREGLGPIVETVGVLRASISVIRSLLDELEVGAGVHLELLDAVLRDRLGSKWWEQLVDSSEAEEDSR